MACYLKEGVAANRARGNEISTAGSIRKDQPRQVCPHWQMLLQRAWARAVARPFRSCPVNDGQITAVANDPGRRARPGAATGSGAVRLVRLSTGTFCLDVWTSLFS